MNPFIATLLTFLIAFLRLMDFLAHRDVIESRLGRKIIPICQLSPKFDLLVNNLLLLGQSPPSLQQHPGTAGKPISVFVLRFIAAGGRKSSRSEQAG